MRLAAEIVAAIKVLAVRVENPTVARDRMSQENVRAFGESASSHMPIQQAVHMWTDRGLYGRKCC